MKKWMMVGLLLMLLAACTEKGIDVNEEPQDEGGAGGTEAVEEMDSTSFFLDDGTVAYFKGEGIEFSTYTRRTEWLNDRYVNVYEDNGGVELVKSYRLDDDKILVLQERPVEGPDDSVTIEDLEEMEPMKTYLSFPLKVGEKIDVWTVVSLDEKLQTPLQDFSDVIVLEEKMEDGAVSRIYFAEGFGEIMREYVGNEEDGDFRVTSVIERVEEAS